MHTHVAMFMKVAYAQIHTWHCMYLKREIEREKGRDRDRETEKQRDRGVGSCMFSYISMSKLA